MEHSIICVIQKVMMKILSHRALVRLKLELLRRPNTPFLFLFIFLERGGDKEVPKSRRLLLYSVEMQYHESHYV